MKESPFACDMSVLTASERSKHFEKMNYVFQSVKEIKEINNGYAFLLPDTSDLLIDLILFVEKERLCCPFFGFTIEIEPEGGSVWLQITGQEGVKEFIKSEFSDFLQDNISWKTKIIN